MQDLECRQCGRPLPDRTGRRGRTSAYCSAACRQKAYRQRKAPQDEDLTDLVATVKRQAGDLDPQYPPALEAGAKTLAGSVRRLAVLARDAASLEQSEIVTTDRVTESVDELAFGTLVERYRRELRVHCYRLLGSFDEAEDLVQETFLRAWRARDTFEGRSSPRAWLYRIATNACLDHLRRNPRTPDHYPPPPGADPAMPTPVRVPWLQPYPDQLLEPAAPAEAGPDAVAVARETIELVFLVAIQHLPPRQRAVLVLRDVIGWSASDTADLLDTSVASVNSALQRARPVLREHLPRERSDWIAPADPTDEQQALLRRYLEVSETHDLALMTELMTELMAEDLRVTMPPNDLWFAGRDIFMAGMADVFTPGTHLYLGDWRSVPTAANRQPAIAHYVRRPGTTIFRAQVLDVLRVVDGRIAEITSFEPHLFAAFGLPPVLPTDE